MKYGKSYCCKSAEGEDIYLFALRNVLDTQVLISNYGAIVTSFKVQKQDGMIIDLVLGFDKIDDYFSESYLKQYAYFGAAIGRYANRIKDGLITIDNKTYQLSKNDGNNQLHGGKNGFDKKVWEVISFNYEKQSVLEFKYKSIDGEEGYPGNLEVIVRFELTDNNELIHQYTATCDQPTAVNLTHHSYFNLNNGKGKILDHRLKIRASNVLEQDKELVATGHLIPVENTKYDFRNFYSIKEKSGDGGYDQSFVIDKTENELSMAAEVISDESNLMLEIFTTEPVVHFYAGKGVPAITARHNIKYGEFSGLCLETQVHPNAINISHFPNTILRPGEEYYHKTVYKVSELPEK